MRPLDQGYQTNQHPGAQKRADEKQPAQASERRVTRETNATARPGLPDKPAPRRTSEQKRTDEQQVRQMKEAQAMAKRDAYQRISTMQAQMVVEQSEARKDRAALRLQPHVVRKPEAGREDNEAVILPPRYRPGQSRVSTLSP